MDNNLSNLGILVTLIIAVTNIIYSIINSKKTQFINTVTSSRINWMGELRDEIARFMELIPCNDINLERILSVENDFDKSHLSKNAIDMSMIDKSLCKITLMLNPNGETDKKIYSELNEIKDIIKQYRMLVLICVSFKSGKKHNISVDSKISDEIRGFILKELELENCKLESNNISIESLLLEKENYSVTIKIIERVINKHIVELLITKRQCLIEMVQKHLKNEWERVKSESEKGRVKYKEIDDREEKMINISSFIVKISPALVVITIAVGWFLYKR